MQYISMDEHERLARLAMGGTPITDDTEADHPAWVQVKKWHDSGDMARIERMVKVFEGLEAMGAVGTWIAKLLTWCAIIGGAYFAASGAIETWVRTIR